MRYLPIRTIVHLSDLHFGNAFEFLLDPLIEEVERLRPDLVVISGDFVEHATKAEFEQARDYVCRFPKPRIVVPGNHDLPFYDPLKRLRYGQKDYERFIASTSEPVFRDEEMLVMGIDSPRIFPMKGGRISQRQVEHVLEVCRDTPRAMVKVLVTHHPLDLPAEYGKKTLARHARTAVEELSPYVDLMLAGHLHLSSTGATAARYKSTGHSVIFAQAGTAISRRNKGEPNSFNLIQITAERIQVRHFTWNQMHSRYLPCPWERFDHGPQGWCKKLEEKESEQVLL